MKDTNGLALINKHRVSLMGIAALLIFVYHECEVVFGSIPVINFIENFIRRTGFCGVDIFFLLSGMGLTYSIEKNTLAKFYGKRYKRIVLPFLIAGVIWGILCGWSFLDYIKNVTGYNFYVKDVSSFLWFVPAIATLYLFFPLYYKCFLRSGNKLLFTIGTIGLWLFLSMSVDGVMREDLYGFTNRIPIFVFGVYWGDLSKAESVKIGRSGWFAVAMTFAVGLVLSFQTNVFDMFLLVPLSNCCVPNFLMATSGTLIAVAILEGLSKVRFVGKAVTKFLSFFGIVSLEFYSVQEFVGIILKALFPKLGHWILNLWVLSVSLILAYAIYGMVKLIFMLFGKLFSSSERKEKKSIG